MTCATRRGAIKAWSVALVAGGLLVGIGSGAAAEDVARRAPVAPCTSTQIVANGAQRQGAQVLVTVTNRGPKPCVLKGFPTVAIAGMGSPDRNKPLRAVGQGNARPVPLAVGGRAVAQLTFTPVLGEADGYCASGAEPSVAPSIVVGVAGGRHQLAPDDGGDFALCGNGVRVTAFRATGS